MQTRITATQPSRTTTALATMLLWLLVTACTSSPNKHPTAEHVYMNGRIYTQSTKVPWAEALAIQDGKLVAVGTNEDIRRWISPGTQVHDLKTRFVMPGIQDAHIHTQMAAEFRLNLSTDPDRPWVDIAADIRRYANENPERKWIIGGNLPWLTDVIGGDDQIPAHRRTLDALVPDQAIALWDVGGHAMLTNSRALQLAGISAATPNPIGGTIERDEQGEPTGVLRELATNLITENATALSVGQMADGLASAIKDLSRVGITAIHEVWTYPTTLHALQLLDSSRRLQARVTVAIAHPVEFVTPAAKQAARQLINNYQHYEGRRVKVRYVKFVLDGSAGGQTLVLTEPYAGTDFRGVLRNPAHVVMQEVTRLESMGLGSVLHAVGDGAVRLALSAIEQARKDNAGSGVRQIVSHSVFINPEDLDRFKAADIIAEFSPYFWQPNEGAEMLRSELGEHRLNWAFPMRAIVDRGNHVAAGSDWPVVFDPNPFPAIESMVTRERPGGSVESFGRTHAVSLEEALRMFTLGGAYAHYQEDLTGSLEPGKYADFIVLDTNPFAVPVRQIHKTQVLQTVLEGQVIYAAEANPIRSSMLPK